MIRRALEQFEVLSDTRCRVGESPVWQRERQLLRWCDTWAGLIYQLDWRTRELVRHDVGGAVGSFGLTDDGRLVVALEDGVHLFCPESRKKLKIADPEPGHTASHPGDRLNDGKVGPDGAFWVGSIHKSSSTASLFRVTGSGKVEQKVEHLRTSNGLAFTSDGRTMYHSDSGVGWIDRYDLDDEGNLSARVRIANMSEDDGRPDGGATDVSGCYWSAGVSAGCINRFLPDGTLVERIDLPLKRPTMVCFGGEDMRTVFVTSIRRPDNATELCGATIAFRTPVPGVETSLFKTGINSSDLAER